MDHPGSSWLGPWIMTDHFFASWIMAGHFSCSLDHEWTLLMHPGS